MSSRLAAHRDRRPARTVAHVHSDWSDDGSVSLDRIAATFTRLRCRVVLMSEHSRGFTTARWQEYVQACRAASTGRVLLVPGIEYGDADDVVHLPVWGEVPFFGDRVPVGKLLPQVAEAGGTAIWAHPWRRAAWRRFEPSWLPYLTAVEVWNRKYDGIAPSREALALARREGLAAAVALDFHTRRQLFPLSLSLDLDDAADIGDTAGGPARAAVFAALAAGRLRPRALGLPVPLLASGPAGAALQGLERARRAAARTARPGRSGRSGRSGHSGYSGPVSSPGGPAGP